MVASEESVRLGLIKDEYLWLQKTVEDFDAKSLTIKAWSVTLVAAALVAAYVQTAPAALLLGSFSAVSFWLVEAIWKVHQQAYYERIREIEDAMADGEAIAPFAISRSWSASYLRNGRHRYALTTMRWPNVFMPHAAIAVAGVLLYLFAAPVAVP